MIQPDSSRILAIYAALLVFGTLFNMAVGTFERRGWIEGYTWLAVVVGVAITLGAVALIDAQFALITLGAFAFSGLPMAIGSIVRHVRARERGQKAIIAEVQDER